MGIIRLQERADRAISTADMRRGLRLTRVAASCYHGHVKQRGHGNYHGHEITRGSWLPLNRISTGSWPTLFVVHPGAPIVLGQAAHHSPTSSSKVEGTGT